MEPKADHSEDSQFAKDLDRLKSLATGQKITLGAVEATLGERGFATLCIAICIPFVQPIPLPGYSIIVGFGLMALALKFMSGQIPSLPAFLKKKEIDTKSLISMIAGAQKTERAMRRFVKERLTKFIEMPWSRLFGPSLFANALAMALPIPPVIMFSNSLPAWSIIFLCLGYIERDGLLIIAGHLVAIGTWAYFFFWWEVLVAGVSKLIAYFG